MLTRRDLLRRPTLAGAGYLAAGVLAGPVVEAAHAAPALAVEPRLYPLASFSPDVDLRGKVAVVSGASSGIGRATAEALTAAGVHVVGTSRDPASVHDRPDIAALLELDVSRARSIDAFVRRLRRHLGRAGHVDILVNNAGRGVFGSPVPPPHGEQRYFEQLDLGLRTDYTGHVRMTNRVLPLLAPSGYARVCFTISAAAYSVATGSLTQFQGYTAAKRSLLAFANAWRTTLEAQGSHIRVTTVNPYLVNTRFPDNAILTERAPSGSAMALAVGVMRRVFAGGIPPAVVGEAYRQLLAGSAPPANVAAGSATEPLATKGGNRGFDAGLLAENASAAFPFVLRP